MIVSIIVAKAQNNVIGKNNQLVWKLSADLRHFKKTTTGHHIIMGRKTYESMGKPLPNRTTIVITRNKDYKVPDGHYVVHDLDAAFAIGSAKKLQKIFILGGAEIYKMALPFTDEIILTKVYAAPEGDAFFPQVNWDEWEKTGEEKHLKNEKNEYDYAFVTYRKKK